MFPFIKVHLGPMRPQEGFGTSIRLHRKIDLLKRQNYCIEHFLPKMWSFRDILLSHFFSYALYIHIQSLRERSEYLNILETVKFDKKWPLNNLVVIKSRSLSHTPQKTLHLLLESFFVNLNGFRNIQVSRSFWYTLYVC